MSGIVAYMHHGGGCCDTRCNKRLVELSLTNNLFGKDTLRRHTEWHDRRTHSMPARALSNGGQAAASHSLKVTPTEHKRYIKARKHAEKQH